MKRAPHRKRVHHYDDAGHFHELTFSCYRRMHLLTNNRWRAMLSQSIDRALKHHGFRLVAFVYMPEHVHLTEPKTILAAIDYIHLNPVRRKLAGKAADWRWSSCRFFHDLDNSDQALPTVHGLPSEIASS